MEKMSATFYILTVLGALLVPIFAKGQATDAPDFNTSTVSQTPESVNMTGSVNVSSETVDDNTTTAENSTINIPSTPIPPEEGSRSVTLTEKPTRDTPFDRTTKKQKDVPTPGPNTNPTTAKKVPTTRNTPASTDSPSDKPVYIIVLLVVILSIAVIAIIFVCVKGNRRRFSVDIHGKHEDAEIPLASVEPEMCDSSPKDMKTFTAVEKSSLTGTGEKTEEEKAPTEPDQQANERPAESQTTKAPAEKLADVTFLDVNDGDPTASTKTSVETLNDVLNENNSNNNAAHNVNKCFIDICLND